MVKIQTLKNKKIMKRRTFFSIILLREYKDQWAFWLMNYDNNMCSHVVNSIKCLFLIKELEIILIRLLLKI